jgi:hypothetical protein
MFGSAFALEMDTVAGFTVAAAAAAQNAVARARGGHFVDHLDDIAIALAENRGATQDVDLARAGEAGTAAGKAAAKAGLGEGMVGEEERRKRHFDSAVRAYRRWKTEGRGGGGGGGEASSMEEGPGSSSSGDQTTAEPPTEAAARTTKPRQASVRDVIDSATAHGPIPEQGDISTGMADWARARDAVGRALFGFEEPLTASTRYRVANKKA